MVDDDKRVKPLLYSIADNLKKTSPYPVKESYEGVYVKLSDDRGWGVTVVEEPGRFVLFTCPFLYGSVDFRQASRFQQMGIYAKNKVKFYSYFPAEVAAYVLKEAEKVA